MGLGAGDGLRARCPECGDGKWELRTEEGQRGHFYLMFPNVKKSRFLQFLQQFECNHLR